MIDFSGQRSTCRTSATGHRTSRPPIALTTPLPSETNNYLNLKRNNDVGNGRRWVTPEAVYAGKVPSASCPPNLNRNWESRVKVNLSPCCSELPGTGDRWLS